MKSSPSIREVNQAWENLDASTPINEALKPLLSQFSRSITRNVPGVIKDTDIECLHDLRVSVRRTRAALAQAKHVLPSRTVLRFRAEFGWLGRCTGTLRDLDVYLHEYQDTETPTSQALAPLLGQIHVLRERERHQVDKVLSSARFSQLMDDWAKLLASPTPRRSTLRDARLPTKVYAGARIRSAGKRVRRQGLAITATSPDESLHELRKTCKALRYSIELFRPLFPKRRIARIVRTLKQLQDNLGAIQDSVVQVQTLRSLGEQLPHSHVEAAIESLTHDREQRRRVAREAFESRFEAFMTGEIQASFKLLFSRA